MTQLVPQTGADRPALLPVDDDRRLSAFTSILVAAGTGFEIAGEHAPTPAVRTLLQARTATLAQWLRASPGDWLLDQLAILCGSMPRQDQAAEQDAKTLLKEYGGVLQDLPRFALEQSFHAAKRGRLGTPPWLPTPAQFRVYAEEVVRPFHAEMRRIAKVLDAKVVERRSDPERRKAIADMARQVAREITMNAALAEAGRTGKPVENLDAEPALTPEETRQREQDRLQSMCAQPVRLSAAARKTFGLGPEAPPAAPGWDVEAA